MEMTNKSPISILDQLDLNPNITLILKLIFREIHNYSLLPNHTPSNITSTYEDDDKIISAISFYLKLLIISIGILGNNISAMAFFRSKLGTGTVGPYLISLALADNIVLASEIPIWITQQPLGYGIIDRYDWLCRITYYAKYTGRMWSACLTLIVTVERYLFVAHPLKKVYIQKHHLHRFLIPLTLIGSLLSVSYSLFLIKVLPYENYDNVCYIKDRDIFFPLDLIVVRGIGDLIMGTCIMVFTILCINVLHKAKKIRNYNIHEQSSLCSSCGNHIPRIQKRSFKSRESQITKMLLMLAIMFLIFKVPYTVLYYCTLTWTGTDRENTSLFKVVINGAKTVAETFSLISYAFNFFVYALLIPSFRNNLCFVFRCRCCHVPKDIFKIKKKQNVQSLNSKI